MVCLLCDFKILLTVFNQSYNCQTSDYLGRNRLPKPFLICTPLPGPTSWSRWCSSTSIHELLVLFFSFCFSFGIFPKVDEFLALSNEKYVKSVDPYFYTTNQAYNQPLFIVAYFIWMIKQPWNNKVFSQLSLYLSETTKKWILLSHSLIENLFPSVLNKTYVESNQKKRGCFTLQFFFFSL